MLKLFRAAILDPALLPESETLIWTGDGPRPKTAPEHAFEDEKTLCGLPKDRLRLMRRNWSPRTKPTCSACRAVFETSYAPSGIPDDYPS